MQPSATPAADSTTLAGATAAAGRRRMAWIGINGDDDGESPAWVRLTMQDPLIDDEPAAVLH